MNNFTNPDTQDFYDAWQMSLLGREPTIQQAYGAGWAAAVPYLALMQPSELEVNDEQQ